MEYNEITLKPPKTNKQTNKQTIRQRAKGTTNRRTDIHGQIDIPTCRKRSNRQICKTLFMGDAFSFLKRIVLLGKQNTLHKCYYQYNSIIIMYRMQVHRQAYTRIKQTKKHTN